jgi:hypothetical protein
MTEPFQIFHALAELFAPMAKQRRICTACLLENEDIADPVNR